jgi:energy-coupling factor transporter ATP-binding protein EcfA2
MKPEAVEDAASAREPEASGQPDAVPRLRLRSLKVHAFREVRPGTELHFGDGFHLILGKNATGKSTLLRLLGAVSTLNFRGPFFAETPFHLEAELEVGDVRLQADIMRSLGPQHPPSRADDHLGFADQETARTTVRIEHQRSGFLQWLQSEAGTVQAFASDPRTDPEARYRFRLRSNFDPLKLSLSTVLSIVATAQFDDPLQVAPQALKSFPTIWQQPGTGAPFDEALGAMHTIAGGDFNVLRGAAMQSTTPWLPEALNFSAQGAPVEEELSAEPLLKQAIVRLGYDQAKMYFGPGAPVNLGWSYSSPSFQFFRNGKAVRRHDQLSFGQQRLFSFAWYLACNPDIAIADELVNGLHAEWIDWCVEAMRDRQSFLTSQNPILVDAVPFQSEEDVRRGIILCTSSPDPTRDATELSFRQLDDRETALLGGALRQSRLDMLSDLLHALDLW